MENIKNEGSLEFDDFANDKEIRKNRAFIKAYQKMIADAVEHMQNRLTLKKTNRKDFDHYLSYQSLDATEIESYASFAHNRVLHVALIEYFSTWPAGKTSNSGSDIYIIGHFSMKDKYPRTYIQKETLGHKVSDLLINIDVDFEHSKKFSRKFHVVTEDKDKLISLLQFKNLDSLASFPNMEIELFDHGCLVRHSRRSISVEEAEKFSDMLIKLISVFK